jgi:hypothetical protein
MSATSTYSPPQDVAGYGRSARDRVKYYDAAARVARQAGEPDVVALLNAMRHIAVAHPETASIWPSQQLLAEQLGRSVRTVQRWIARAVALGILCRRRQWTRRAGGLFTGRASRYWLAPFRVLRARLAQRTGRSHGPVTSGGSLPLRREELRPPAPRGRPKGPAPGRMDENGCFHNAICGCPDCYPQAERFGT